MVDRVCDINGDAKLTSRLNGTRYAVHDIVKKDRTYEERIYQLRICRGTLREFWLWDMLCQ